MPPALLPTLIHISARPQDFVQPVRQPRCPKNFAQQQQRPPRIIHLSDSQQCLTERGIGGKLLDAAKQPRIDLRVLGPQIRLQPRRIALRIVHQKARINFEKPRQQLACRVRQVRARATLNLRKVRLAKSAAQLALHGRSQFKLSHGPAESTQ